MNARDKQRELHWSALTRAEKAEEEVGRLEDQHKTNLDCISSLLRRAEKARAEAFILRAELDTETDRADKAEAEADRLRDGFDHLLEPGLQPTLVGVLDFAQHMKNGGKAPCRA